MHHNLPLDTQNCSEPSEVKSKEYANLSLLPGSLDSAHLPIYRHFERYAQQFPDSVAVTFAGEQITYGGLNLKANQLAHYLTIQQVKAQDCVGVLVEAGFEIVIAILAVHKLNGIYLPIDPEFPLARIESIVEQAKPSVLLCASGGFAEVEASLSPLNIKTINLPLLDWSSYQGDNPHCECPLNSISHIFFTSGTTGTPKGVVSDHQNLIHYIFSAQAKYHFDAEDSFLAATRFTFSISLLMLLLPLVSGGRVEMINQEQLLEPQLLAQAIEQSTFFHLGPSILKMLLDFLRQQKDQLMVKRFAHVKHASSGGDMIPPQILNRLNQIFTNAEVYAIYGSSEISCMGCSFLVARDSELKQTMVGKPFDNVQLRILDAQQRVVPVGVKGEICFAGAGITSGYLNLPQLTQEKYFQIDGQRFYRTGDLGRLTVEGNLQVLGRTDFQVQIRGLRIELADIESNLNLHPGIISSVVVAREDYNREKQLVAYVIAVDSDSSPTTKELWSFLTKILPQYMIPSQFVVLKQFPLNSNGKIDRRALPAPEQVKIESYIAPRTEIERQLVEIWASVLKLEPTAISIKDNFLALGGHSLLATQVTSRIRDTFEVAISLSSLFELATIGELAPRIEIANADITSEPICPLADRSQIPLSLAQQRLWFLYQMEPQSSAYNIPLALQLTGLVNVTALKQSITEIVRRHEVLRTNFWVIEDIPFQVIEPTVTIPLTIIDLQTLSEVEREQEYLRLAAIEASCCFNLTENPLLRTTLVHLGCDTQVLLVTMHHIIADGWSLEVFTQELASLYSAFIQGQSSSLPELSLQYGDFAAWQRQWSQTEAFSTQLAYWQHQLAALPALLELPTDHPRPAIQTFSGRVERFSLSCELTEKLQHLAQRSGSTLFMTLLAALAILLSRYSNSQDLVIGSPIANRNRREIEPLIGFFVNTLVLRTNLEGNPSFAELLAQVREMTLDAYAHQDVPFDKLVEILQPDRSLSHNPLFQVMFILQNGTATTKQMSDVTQAPLAVEQVTAQFDLTLSMEPTAAGLKGFWQYNSDLFDAQTIARMSGHFQVLLEAIVMDPDQAVSALSLLTTAERNLLLSTWNNTKRVFAHEQCVHQLLEVQVTNTPEQIAVVFADQQLTYRQLNFKANQLARYLQQKGVTVETLVGVSMERSLEMLIALLAILKAGGAYVPLDPHYPPDRLALMVEDSGLSILLTKQETVNVIPNYLGQTICLDTQWYGIALNSGDDLDTLVKPHNLAYIIYTSGSTGKPKGVQLEHRGVTNFLQAMQTEPGISPKDTLLAVTSISFDIAVLELFLPLLVGAKVIIAAQQVTADANQLLGLMLRSGATIMQATPATWRMLTAARWHEIPPLKMLCGGEPLPHDLAKLMLQRCSSLWNVYGPTEATVWATIYEVKSDFDSISIGHPLANTYVQILDPHGQLVPIGVPGEIHLGGVQLARGYLNRPDLTAEKFIVNPHNPSERLYKTGDLGRYLANGNVECLGRIDNQVKIRGFRIELGEIESHLGLHPLVSNCVVTSREDVPGDKCLVAYIVAEEDSPTVKELRQFLEPSLPNYMIPSHFVILERFPLTPNGKIDRRALPAPEQVKTELYIAPRTEIERQLLEIWASLLQLKSTTISMEDNFFALGGHSLLAMQLLTRLEEAFEINLPLAVLFQLSTIEQQAIFFEQEADLNSWSSLALIQPKGSRPPLFLFQGIGIYYPLSYYLGEDQPVYGLSIEMIDESEHWFNQIEDLVVLYIKEIKKIQPQGPYYFGGLSFGGIIALEAAQQLQAQGEKVALLALFDTWGPKAFIPSSQFKKLMVHGQKLSRFGLKYVFSKQDWLKAKLLKLVKPSRILFNLVKLDSSNQHQEQAEQPSNNLNQAYLDARDNYVPQIYAGRIKLFRSTENDALLEFGELDPQLGWGNMAIEGLDIFEIPGDHLGILQEPNVAVLARALQDCIDQCQK